MNRSWPRLVLSAVVWLAAGSGCTTPPPCSAPDNSYAPAASTSLSSAALQQKVKAQEKRINELSAQLKLLKHIDQDQQKQR